MSQIRVVSDLRAIDGSTPIPIGGGTKSVWRSRCAVAVLAIFGYQVQSINEHLKSNSMSSQY